MKSIITLIIILLGIGFTFAQEVTLDDKKYQVDDKTILSNGTDVTNALNEQQQQKIKSYSGSREPTAEERTES